MMVIPTNRVGIYARVSTSDKDQNPATQLLPLREFVTAHGWAIVGEFVDHTSVTDLCGRTAWRNLLDQASRRKVDLVVVWRIDRAFRSVHEAAYTLERLREWNVGLRSYSEPWLDTTSPIGEALYYITVAYAQLEHGIFPERVRASMSRAGNGTADAAIDKDRCLLASPFSLLANDRRRKASAAPKTTWRSRSR